MDKMKIKIVYAPPKNPPLGTLYENTTDSFLYFYDGTQWKYLCTKKEWEAILSARKF